MRIFWTFVTLLALAGHCAGQTLTFDSVAPDRKDSEPTSVQKLLHGWMNAKFKVGAQDVISPATVPVYNCGAAGTTPTVSGNVYALSTNEFFSVTNGTGMLQAAFWQGGSPGPQSGSTYTPGEIRVYLSSTPWTNVVLGTPWTNHFLVTGPSRLCPMLTFSTYAALGTNATLGVLSSSHSGLNWPVRATDGSKNLYGLWISAGAWTNAPTATTNLLTLTGICDGQAVQNP